MARIGQLHGTYDFNKVDIIVGTRALSGFENGTTVTAERAEQSFTKKVDIDGSVTRARSNDKTGTVTFSLAQFSEDNAYSQTHPTHLYGKLCRGGSQNYNYGNYFSLGFKEWPESDSYMVPMILIK